MRTYLLIIAALILGCIAAGCTETKTPAQIQADQDAKKLSDEIWFHAHIRVVEYEGHEYLWYSAGHNGGICHKVNCKYCENKE